MPAEPTAGERRPTSPGAEPGSSAEPGSTAAALPSPTSPPPTLSASAGETPSPTIQRARYPPGRSEALIPPEHGKWWGKPAPSRQSGPLAQYQHKAAGPGFHSTGGFLARSSAVYHTLLLPSGAVRLHEPFVKIMFPKKKSKYSKEIRIFCFLMALFLSFYIQQIHLRNHLKR